MSDRAKERVYLVDGNSNVFRAYYAIRGLSNRRGEPTNAVYGFLQMLRKLVKDHQPRYLGVAFDVSRETVRTERYAEYKANRAPMPDDLRGQLAWIRKVVEAYRIPLLELRGYEADDVLGTLARKAVAAGYEVVLVSPDKDLMQLVGDGVFQYHTGRERLYDRAAVVEEFGVPPERVPDVQALTGDSVDNVPGVPGIGDKGARQLIAEFGTLQALLERAGEVGRKAYREGLQGHREAALLSLELVTIHTDLPIAFEPDKLVREEPDVQALLDLCWELDFKTVVTELEATYGRPAPPTTPAKEIAGVADWERFADGASGPLWLGLVGEPAPVGVAVASGDGDAVYVDLRRDELRPAVAARLRAWLGDPGRAIGGHDLKEVLRLAGADVEPRAKLFDTMLASYLLRPALRSHGLAEVVLDRLHQGLATLPSDLGGLLPGDPAVLRAAAERVGLPRQMAEAMRRELAAESLERVYDAIEAPLMPVLMRMEERGILLDVEFLRGMARELGDELSTLEKSIYSEAGERFNLDSPRQLGEILFEKLGYPALKKTRKTKSYATGAEVLEELAARGYPLPEKLLRYRELSKLRSTYVVALPELVGADGRLHTRFNQAVAATGRLSSANPNLQNIPIRTEVGARIRRAFRAAPGHLLVVADYSQIELRVLAHIASEPAMIEAFRSGQDVHAATAAAVFGGSPLLVTPDQRRMAKVINFGILYGMSGFGLARQLGISKRDAEQFIEAYLDRYAGVRRYTEETVERAKETGWVETLYGRRRFLPDLNSRNYNLRENARRMAINARIQGTAADLLKLAMIAVEGRLRREQPAAGLLLTVHDELVVEAPAGSAEAVGAVVREEMEGVAELAVPLVVEVGTAETWDRAKA